MDLYDRVFREDDSTMDKLMSDPTTRSLIISEFGAQINQDNRVMTKGSTNAILIATYDQDFASSDEAVYVARILISNLTNTSDVLPLLTEHTGLQFAHRCLTSLTFFKKRMQYLNERHSAPNPDYYREVSRNIFYKSGLRSLGDNHERWEDHIPRVLKLFHN